MRCQWSGDHLEHWLFNARGYLEPHGRTGVAGVEDSHDDGAGYCHDGDDYVTVKIGMKMTVLMTASYIGSTVNPHVGSIV